MRNNSHIPLVNYHSHTYRCKHATGEVVEFVNAASEAGLEIFGVNITFDILREEDRMERLIKKVEKLEKENQYILNLLKEKNISTS